MKNIIIIGIPPTSTMGLGFVVVSSESLVPIPPARITAFIINKNLNYLILMNM